MDFSISTEGSGRSHRVIGYVIGVLGLLVCCVVIYGVGGPLFPTRRISIGDTEKGNYENFAPIIAKFNFLAGLCWLFAVFKDKTLIMLLSILFWIGNLVLAAVCLYFYYFEGIIREFKDREVFLLAGVGYWICNLFVVGIWYMTRKKECQIINESELLPIK